MSMLVQSGRFGAPPVIADDLFVFDQRKTVSTTGSVHSFTGFNVGSATVGPFNGQPRVVVLAINWQSGAQSISSVTLNSGGITATRIGNDLSNAGSCWVGFAVALVPSGTTVDVDVTFTGSVSNGSAVSLWYGFPPEGAIPCYATGNVGDVTSITLSDVVHSDTGQYLACAITQDSSPTSSITWNGGDTVHQRQQGNFNSGTNQTTIADWLTSADGYTNDATFTTTNNVGTVFAVLFYNFGANDPFIESVIFLPDTDRGTNGQTTASDLSPAVRGSGTAVDGIALSTAQKYTTDASTSMLGDGASDYFTWPDAADLTLGTSSFTIECAYYCTGLGTQSDIMGQWGSGQTSWALRVGTSGQVIFFYSESAGGGGGTDLTSANGVITTNTWYYIMVAFDGSNYQVRVNGATVASSSTPRNLANSSAVLGWGGIASNTDRVRGYLANGRITKGVCRIKVTGNHLNAWRSGVTTRLHPTT